MNRAITDRPTPEYKRDDIPVGAQFSGPGHRSPKVCALVGISYRQIDYWARIGLVVPSLGRADGSGTHRRYSDADVRVLRVVKMLLGAGLALHAVRSVIGTLDTNAVGYAVIRDGEVSMARTPNELAGLIIPGEVAHVLLLDPEMDR